MKFILLIALSFVCAVSASSYGYAPEPAPYYEEKIVYIPGPPGNISIVFCCFKSPSIIQFEWFSQGPPGKDGYNGKDGRPGYPGRIFIEFNR